MVAHNVYKGKIMPNTERGRSLVETLGMLSIMGVLSVMGIWGYGIAMDRHHANTLMYEASKRATIVMSQISAGHNPSITDFIDNGFGEALFDTDVFQRGLYKQFGIKVSGVKKSVCQNILNTIGDKTAIRRLSLEGTPTMPLTTCNDNNDFLFIYNEDMTADDKVESPRTCRTHNDCKSVCATCEIQEGEEMGVCANECEEPVKLCQSDTDCNTDNECMVCDSETNMCKNGCERVEYLQSTGTQYIDTGIGVKNNTVFKAIFSIASTSTGRSYFGARNSSNERFQIVNSIGIGGGYYLVNSVYPIANQKYEIEMHASGEMYLDGVKRNASTGTFSQVSFERNLFLFATNYYDSNVPPGASTFWEAQIFEGDVLVRDFIPVISPETSQYAGQPCMFDKVTKKLFCNAGSGTFDYRPK